MLFCAHSWSVPVCLPSDTLGSQFFFKTVFALQLIVATPKSLLRLPEARSSFDDMIEGSGFQRVIPESGPASESSKDVKKLLFCSGKIYYELIKEREKINRVNDVAITRIEQVRMGYCGASCAWLGGGGGGGARQARQSYPSNTMYGCVHVLIVFLICVWIDLHI